MLFRYPINRSMLVAISTATTNGTVSDSELPVAVFENALVTYVATFINAVIVTIMIYDILLTLDDEKEYVWSSKWSPIKIIFLIVRYFPISIYVFITITHSVRFPNLTCSTFQWYGRIGCVFVMAAADMFLAYRVYAFCGANKYLLTFLIITFLGWEATVFCLTVVTVLQNGVTVLHSQHHSNFFLGLGCTTERFTHNTTIVWIGMLCYQSVLFLCFILSAVYNHSIFDYGLFQGLKQAPIYKVFVRDGLWAYFVIVVSLTLNVAVSLKQRNILESSSVLLLTVVTSICICRLILNIRSAAYKPTLSDISI